MSIRKFSLIAAVTAVAAMAMAGSALASGGASLTTSKADPATNVTAGKANAGGLFLDVTNCEAADTSCTGSGGTSPTQVLDGVDIINISYSGEVSIGKSKQPICQNATIAALSYKNALAACNGSMMGAGGATVCLGNVTPGSPCSPVAAKTIVFRGPDFTDPGLFGAPGKVYPGITLYADIGAGVAVVPATITPASKADKTNGYKSTLHVFGSGDPTTPPSQSITDFYANVNAGVKTKCGITGQTGTTNIKYQGQWLGNSVAKQDNTTQPCSYQP